MYKTLWKEIMTDKRTIEYRFLHWGPFVCSYRLTSQEIADLKELKIGKDYRNNLAGHLDNEKTLDKEQVYKILNPYLNSYAQGFYDYRRQPLCNGFEIEAAWINRQSKNEFNPPHNHGGDLSFVIYTEVPDELEKECMSAVSSSPGPGCITFDFNMPTSTAISKLFLQTHSHLPSVGDMFIFPAALPHWVYPFKTTEGERVSISGNLYLIDGDKTLTGKNDSKEK